jgi:hypothetical protein
MTNAKTVGITGKADPPKTAPRAVSGHCVKYIGRPGSSWPRLMSAGAPFAVGAQMLARRI